MRATTTVKEKNDPKSKTKMTSAEKAVSCPRAMLQFTGWFPVRLIAGRIRIGAVARARERRFAVPSVLLTKWHFHPTTHGHCFSPLTQ